MNDMAKNETLESRRINIYIKIILKIYVNGVLDSLNCSLDIYFLDKISFFLLKFNEIFEKKISFENISFLTMPILIQG